MRGLREYTPKLNLLNTTGNNRMSGLIYHKLSRSKSYPNQKINPNQKVKHSKSLTSQFKIKPEPLNFKLDQNCTFFFEIPRERNGNLDTNENHQPPQQTEEFCNFNCSACNKWFFCKRLLDHQIECSVLNKFNGSGDKVDRSIITNDSFKLGNNNILRNSLVCYLCGNRYSFRSISYHIDRCGRKFKRFFTKNEVPQRPMINENLLLDSIGKQHSLGNVNFNKIDAFNEVMYKASLQNEILLKSRLKYY